MGTIEQTCLYSKKKIKISSDFNCPRVYITVTINCHPVEIYKFLIKHRTKFISNTESSYIRHVSGIYPYKLEINIRFSYFPIRNKL